MAVTKEDPLIAVRQALSAASTAPTARVHYIAAARVILAKVEADAKELRLLLEAQEKNLGVSKPEAGT